MARTPRSRLVSAGQTVLPRVIALSLALEIQHPLRVRRPCRVPADCWMPTATPRAPDKITDVQRRLVHAADHLQAAGQGRSTIAFQVLRATATTRHRWRCSVELGGVVVHLAADGRPAFGTDIVVLVAAWENEQELPPHRGCAATCWAQEARRLKLAEAVGRAHSQILSLVDARANGNANYVAAWN